MEQLGVVVGAQPAHMYLQRGNPGAEELVACSAPEIEVRLLIARKPGRCLRVTREMSGQVMAYLVAARTNARTDGGGDVFGARSISRPQCADGHDRRTSGRSPPAGVNCCHSAGSMVGEEDWNTVRYLHRERKRAIIGDGDIRLRIARFSAPRLDYVGAVHLAHARDGVHLYAQRGRKVLPSSATERVEHKIARAEAVTSRFDERPAPECRSP